MRLPAGLHCCFFVVALLALAGCAQTRGAVRKPPTVAQAEPEPPPPPLDPAERLARVTEGYTLLVEEDVLIEGQNIQLLDRYRIPARTCVIAVEIRPPSVPRGSWWSVDVSTGSHSYSPEAVDEVEDVRVTEPLCSTSRARISVLVRTADTTGIRTHVALYSRPIQQADLDVLEERARLTREYQARMAVERQLVPAETCATCRRRYRHCRTNPAAYDRGDCDGSFDRCLGSADIAPARCRP